MLHAEIGLGSPLAPTTAPRLTVDDLAKGSPAARRAFHPEELVEARGASHRPSKPRTTRNLPDPEVLRRHAWEIGERRAHETYESKDAYANLQIVSPAEAFLVWRVHQRWVDETARRKGAAWSGARLIARFYDVSFIEFNGFNAHCVRDISLDRLHGERIIALPLAGTWQIAEVGYLLRNREFLPGARSPAMLFPPTTMSLRSESAALYVDDRFKPEPVASPWDGAAYVRERSKPKLRPNLRIAMLSFEAATLGHSGPIATFVSALASELHAQGQQVHVFVPEREGFHADRDHDGVHYHCLALEPSEGSVATALAFARSLEARLLPMPSFDFFHIQEWMTALLPWLGTRPTLLALTSLEGTRRNGAACTNESREIEKIEREIAHAVDCLLVPDRLRDEAITTLGTDRACVHAFPMEGRPIDEWEMPLDTGKVKAEIGLHPFDRMLLFVGPLESGAGPDLLVDAMPTVLSRTPNARVVYVGCGGMQAHLMRRAEHLGIARAIRFLGHVELPALIPLLRASEALLMPSRHRVPQDEGVVGLARRAGRAVLTTHGGPAHCVRHEENGVVAYDNPPSIVWGMSRLLDDARHTEDMGRRGQQHGEKTSWAGLARHYADLCAQSFFELTEEAGTADARRQKNGGRA